MIEWLMQRTVDGATYLETIVLITLLFVVVGIGIKTWGQIIKDFKGGEDDD